MARGATAVLTAVAFARAEASPPIDRSSSPDRSLRCGGATTIPSQGAWDAPLDRRISIPIDGLPLRDALTRVASAAELRLTYVAELLPLDRRHCLALVQVRVGDALQALLQGTALAPIAAGRDQVVLAPTTADAQARARAAVRVGTLERVVVTGDRSSTPLSGSVIAVDVIDGRDLEAQGATTLAAALNGAVPGMWIWNAAPGAATLRMGSMRGASSFGASAPKVYIDGIEVANPLVLTQLRPETVDRVEIIRGPQGSALFGADAIGGVLQITTRHDPAQTNGVSTQLRTSAGVTNGGFAGTVSTQDHALSIRMGSPTRAGGLSIATSRLGDYVPSGSTSQWNAAGDLKLVGTRRSLIASARFFSQEADNPASIFARMAAPSARGTADRATPPTPMRWAPFDSMRGDAGAGMVAWSPANQTAPVGTNSAIPAPQSTQQYTIGAVLTETRDSWTSRITLGADGYRLANPIAELGSSGSAADSALRAASGAADRLTVRVMSSRNATVSDNSRATITIGGEHTTLRDATAPTSASAGTPAALVEPASVMRHSTGGLAKVDLEVARAIFLSAGARIEQNLGYTTLAQISVLPTIGAAYVRTVGPASLKLRSAWGRAIRPPRAPMLTMGPAINRTAIAAGLEPEIQSGIETGMDLAFGQRATLSISRFDQRASGLIQASTVTGDLSFWRQQPTRRLVTALQNVGVIANRGWEFAGSTRAGRFSLASTLSLVSS
ncbi:MAG: TonB-dependent receptor plug domain-containing protein, partial [Gemmatimonadaceae bacterium]|nr:TonB-dependent receptor plug domain-containing protein [Gemmatimonadaceae bacterium]